MFSQHGVEVTTSAAGVRLRDPWWRQWWLLLALAGFALWGVFDFGIQQGDWASAGFMVAGAVGTAAWVSWRASGTIDVDRNGIYIRKSLTPGRLYEWRDVRDLTVEEWTKTNADDGSTSTDYWPTVILNTGETVRIKMGGSEEQAQLIKHHIDSVRQRWDLSHI